MHLPDGLLTLGSEHDVGLYPHIIAPDPYASHECLDVFPSPGPFSLTAATMGDDDPPSGRLRPRKSIVRNLQTKSSSKSDSQVSPDKQRRTSTPSKASPNKHNDLLNKSEFSTTPQFLCPYCEKKFVSKQSLSKHSRRMHPAVFKQGSSNACIFCNHTETNGIFLIRHMIDCHPNQYFACLDCSTRFSSTTELADHKLNVCEKQKISYRSKLRHNIAQGIKKKKKSLKVKDTRYKNENPPEEHSFNGVVISCELKPSLEHNADDIEDNITTNLILPPSKNLGSSSALEKNAVIILDDLQWNKRIPPNFTFHNTDADQILSRLGVVHKSPRTGESTKKEWFKSIDESSLKFEKCFDTTFYSKVSSNVQENLSKFLDGSFNFNPDPESVIKTRKSKKSVVINTAEGFPILLACEQYSRNVYDGYLPRSLAPRHKWIRDNTENERSLMNPDQIKRDSHVNNCIITFVSGLDIWTQLCMRRKFEDKNTSQAPEKKVEKRLNVRKELEDILESRELPSSSQVEKPKDKLIHSSQGLDFAASLGLVPSAPKYEVQPAVLSGEWVRPRCYVCCACGAQTRDPKTLTSHIATRHPNAQVQHYEIVGEVLLNADILKHLYVPSSQMSNRTRPLRGFRECTKCMKSISLEDLHQHMLDCAGDTPAVRRRQGRHRPFGVRRRRPRLADNTVRKKIRKDIRTRQRQKNMIRPKQKIRTEVGDAETIRKMLADLPAKRHRILVNPLNHMTRPRVKRDNQKKKIMMKKHSSDDKNVKGASGSKDNTRTIKLESSSPRSVAFNTNTNDDRKSLRSKRRVVVKTTRQSQSVQRNANITRIKRKSIRLKEQQSGKKDAIISRDLQTELTNDNSFQKMDIKNTEYKTRERSNETGSNNRSEQRQGCSRSNNNSNNSVAPTQSVPLKHSIASLTANSETHDKSVQFHHLFLVQQECNNVNQQRPSEERTLFENEDVIVRLDKPPLNFNQKSTLDLQKNKTNKPRKGLNDCIAMLKHKLLDPMSSEATGHVSVQCGGDEPLDFDVTDVKHTTLDNNETLRVIPLQDNANHNKSSQNYEQHSTTSMSINKISQENENRKCFERVMVECGKNDIDSVKLSPKIVSEIEIFTDNPNDSSHKTVEWTKIGVCSESKIVSENCNSDSNLPSTKDEGSSRNLDTSNISSQISTKYSEFETIGKNTCEYDILCKEVSTSVTHESMLSSQKEMRIRTEMDMTQNLQTEIFLQSKEFENVPAVIPPAHASTNVVPMLTIPLDLSSNNQITSQKNCYSVQSYDDYETLDLSNKTSYGSTSVTNYDVVDLRVKPLQPAFQDLVDLCIKSSVDNTQKLKDLSDNTPTDLSVKGKETKHRYDKYNRTFPIQDLLNHPKISQECRYTPLSQNGPTDLSGKTSEPSASKIEQSNINPGGVEHSGSIQDNVSKLNDALSVSNVKISPQIMESSENKGTQNDKCGSDYILPISQELETVHSLKSNNCDSALVIPQYKIKATTNVQAKMPLKKNLPVSVDEYSCRPNNVPNVTTSSASLCPSEKMSVNMNMSRDLLGDTSSSNFMTKSITETDGTFISTQVTGLNFTPLNTSCSSVPISTDKAASLSSCQSTIGTTVVSSTTINATSAEVPSSYNNPLEHKVMAVSQKYGTDKAAKDDTSTEIDRKLVKQNDSTVAVSSDQDPETARKIAMLPKELVEIIGNIPADHRNQLLNVLPQYVSASSASSQNETEKVLSLEPLATTTSQNESFGNNDFSSERTSSLSSQENIISKHNLPSPRCSDQIPQMKSSNTVQQFSFSPTNDINKKSLFNIESDLTLKDDIKVDKDHRLEDPYMALVSNKISQLAEYDKHREKIIDLTDEENSLLSIDAAKAVEDLSNATKLSNPNISTLMSIEKPLKRKVNSEKTASLRAVRIKAPAERQKENKLLKRMSGEQHCKPNITDSEENEVKKSLESNASLAIQQAEISSTQSNRNVQPNMNNEPEANGNESDPPLSSAIETIVENKDTNSHEGITKVAVVTSSIPMNDAIREDSNEINLNTSFSTKDVDTESFDDTAKRSARKDFSATNINASIVIKTVEFKRELSNKSSISVTETNEKRIVPIYTKNKTEKSETLTAINDDDSEDDVSLASILKQKNDSIKSERRTDILPDITNAKNEQEIDNVLKPEVYKANASSKIKKKIKRARKYKETIGDSRVLAETANVVNQQSKNKTKKRNKVEPTAVEKFDIKDIKDAPLSENFKKKANNESDVVNSSEQENTNVILVDQDIRKPKSNISKDKTGTVKASIEKESRKYSTNNKSSSYSDEDVLSTVQKENMNNSVSQTKKVCKTASDGQTYTTEQEKVVNDKVSTGLSTVNLEKNAKCLSHQSQSKEDRNLEEYPSHLESKKNKKVKLANALECTKEEVLKDSLKFDANVSSPLRRSRRGKSLYMDKVTDSILVNETGIDHKTPLTKKQLIFSKLQLDEESLSKQIENSKQTDVIAAEVNADTVIYNKDKVMSSDLTTDSSIDKGKKRKNTNPVKGKSKKKKSLGISPDPNNEFIAKDVIDTITEPNLSTIRTCIENQNSVSDKVNIQGNIDKKNSYFNESEENKAVSEYNNTCKDKLNKNLIEKRKCDSLTTYDGSQITKPKKNKVQPVSETKVVDKNISTGTNILVAAKRIRSKSVIVKSTASDLYDPYDIDFDDINEKAEPFRKSLRHTKATKKNKPDQLNKKTGSDFKLNEKEITAGHDSKIDLAEIPKSSLDKINADIFSSNSKYDKAIEENICHCNIENSKSKQELSIDKNEDLSDSDDSSKSDVPLKQYLEGKEKRMAEKDDNTSIDTEPNEKAVSETEEQLKSEQFMASFGFFSKRQPRKSNLLAAKKIAETFNIIANEKDDTPCDPKRMSKKVCPIENKRNHGLNPAQKSGSKIKKLKNTKSNTNTEPCYCYVCKKPFFRADNYLRHQMTLLHISKLSEFELKLPTNRIIEEPNYLVAFRDQINRIQEIALQLAVETKKKSKIKLPSLDVILEQVNIIIEKQKLKLSNDQALFLDCCELLKESHKPEVTKQESILVVNEIHDNLCCSQASLAAIDIMEKLNNDVNADSKSECDSITAKSILESEEVRNLENDLISGLKEAAKINRRISKNIQTQQDDLLEIGNESFSIPNKEERPMQVDQFDLEEPEISKSKKHLQTKVKMYPDVEDIDLFEDKFDKIKRKCRSQAAAAKHTQSVLEASSGYKTRKKSERTKGKKALKKNYQSTVLTKGALKGFDGIKVSIPTSEINVPGANVSLPEVPTKKKKRKFSRKKREKKDSESSTKYDSDSRMREGASSQRKHDVYEFMDNEDAELFEFRPSTLMERFKSMNSKEYHSKETSKLNMSIEEVGNTSESGSDEDDFVYMSDDYVCSDDETENSLISCEISNLKAESRKNFTPPKRKDVIEKNAVMGKIFKHNAVRSDKKGIKAKEPDKLKTNLDQLFDSLLEDEKVPSTINNEETLTCISESEDLLSKNSRSLHSHDVSQSTSFSENKAPSSQMHENPYLTEWDGLATSKQGEYDLLAEPSTSKSSVMTSKKIGSNEKSFDQTSPNKELQDDFCNEAFDDTGVARQRARRKCTVGKQNVLAETWSSESEPDGLPIRSNSAESLVCTASRKKKGKKREGNHSSGRRGSRSMSNKKQDAQSRVNSNCRNISLCSATGNFASENQVENATEARELENKGHDRVDMQAFDCATPLAAPAALEPLVAKGQPRSATSYWSPGGATEQEHIQQHGWIVGDSHKKLVTMLAHAKGRKRHNDDERHLIE